MMGSAPAGGGGKLSFVDVIGMLKDEPAYQTKLREIGNRLNETRALKQQTAEINAKMEETKKFTAEMAAKAEAQLVEARQLKDEAGKQVALATEHRTKLAQDQADWDKHVAEQKEKDNQNLINTFAAREEEVLAKEQKLLAEIKKFEGIQADRDDRANEFDAYRKNVEAKVAQREADVRAGESKLVRNLQEVEATKIALKEKLDKIKSISVG